MRWWPGRYRAAGQSSQVIKRKKSELLASAPALCRAFSSPLISYMPAEQATRSAKPKNGGANFHTLSKRGGREWSSVRVNRLLIIRRESCCSALASATTELQTTRRRRKPSGGGCCVVAAGGLGFPVERIGVGVQSARRSRDRDEAAVLFRRFPSQCQWLSE